MTTLDATTLAQQAQRLGLVTESQLLEGWEEVGKPGGDAEPLLRALERKGYLTPWQSQKLLKGDTDGYFLGGCRLLYKIASGSFGRVFRAEECSSGRVVAIKVLRRRWSDNPHNIELFEREGKVGLSLRHPNIVEVLSVHRDPATGSYYIIMEFVEGNNLRDFLQIRKKLQPAEALRILDEAAAGLAYAYSRGITHRDVKLTNILISSQGVAKLVDFGLAKIYSSMGHADEKIERTVDYAGLEKATGVKPGDVRSDIYFLGCVLYEMLSGRSPLVMTRDRHARMQKQRFDNVAPLTAGDAAGPPSLLRLVESMMALDPQQRFQTPSQLLEAVRAVRREVEGGGDAARPGTPSARSVFVVEKSERLQGLFREQFKALGYRVLIAADPHRALDRFRRQPFDALVLNARSVGKEGQLVFEKILDEAGRHQQGCAGILLLDREQAAWADGLTGRPGVAVLVRPTLGQVVRKLQHLVPQGKSAG
jgi:CheY-like chemotaxis protein